MARSFGVRDVLKDPKQLWQLLKDSVSAWIDDFAPSMGAAISYYTVFSIAPLLLIVIAVAGLVLGQEAGVRTNLRAAARVTRRRRRDGSPGHGRECQPIRQKRLSLR
jgi:uncharacterized BrkB/YihY/UPF0761 family membrane protein